MSVLIKGMEVPAHCIDCPFMVSRNNDDCILQSAEANENFETWTQMKACCPLVPVPPHGRLIDERWLKKAMITTLEALKKNPKMDNQEMHLIAAFDTLRVMVEDAPTIIEAEEGEK